MIDNKNLDLRYPDSLRTLLAPVYTGPPMCKKVCEEGEALLDEISCTSCIAGCRSCEDFTLNCLDIVIDYDITTQDLSLINNDDYLDIDGLMTLDFFISNPDGT